MFSLHLPTDKQKREPKESHTYVWSGKSAEVVCDLTKSLQRAGSDPANTPTSGPN